MADWTPIPNSALDVAKPGRAVDMLALRDNPIAMARGAPGSPSVTPWASARAAVTAGATLRYHDVMNTFVTTLSTYVVAYTFGLMNSGVVRLQWTHNRVGGSGSSRIIISRIRAAVETELTADGTYVAAGVTTQSYDATIQAGDVLLIKLRSQNAGQPSELFDVKLLTNGELLHPFIPYYLFGAEPT